MVQPLDYLQGIDAYNLGAMMAQLAAQITGYVSPVERQRYETGAQQWLDLVKLVAFQQGNPFAYLEQQAPGLLPPGVSSTTHTPEQQRYLLSQPAFLEQLRQRVITGQVPKFNQEFGPAPALQPTLERETLQQRQREFAETLPLQRAELTGFLVDPSAQQAFNQSVDQLIDHIWAVYTQRTGDVVQDSRELTDYLRGLGLLPPGVTFVDMRDPNMREVIKSYARTAPEGSYVRNVVGAPPRGTPTLAAQQFAAQILSNPANVLAAPFVARNILGANVPTDLFLQMPAVQAVASGSTAPLQGGAQGVRMGQPAGSVRTLPTGDQLPNLTPQSFGRQVYGALTPTEREITTRLGSANTGIFPEDFVSQMARTFIPGAAPGTTVYG